MGKEIEKKLNKAKSIIETNFPDLFSIILILLQRKYQILRNLFMIYKYSLSSNQN